MELDDVTASLTALGVDTRDIDFESLDAAIREIATSAQNRRAFASAVAAIRRNSGSVLHDRWTT